MNWIILVLAGIFEIAWAIGLKYTEGFTKTIPSMITIFFMVVSMGLLAYAVRSLPLGTAYAVWTGIGAVGTVIAGIFIFNEPVDFWRILFLLCILIGIIGLKIISSNNTISEN